MAPKATIYYWSPDYSTPVGGVKILYRDVDILNQNGFHACILHQHKGFRCDWFENNTPVTSIAKTRFTSADYLVIPENYGSLYANPEARPKAAKVFQRLFNTPARKVVFNQNTYNTFSGADLIPNANRSIYNDPSIIATMVVSEHNREYLRFAYPNLPIFRIHNAINGQRFQYQPEKKPRISFMPRKNPEHAMQVLNLLYYHGDLNGIEIVPIAGKTENETAEILRESLIFLSFGYPEGCPLPPAEAMSCGCVVIGYHGMGGREYFKPEFCFPVEMGDILGFAQTVSHVLDMYRKTPEILAEMGRQAAAFINLHYNEEQERRDVLTCWQSITGQDSQA